MAGGGEGSEGGGKLEGVVVPECEWEGRMTRRLG